MRDYCRPEPATWKLDAFVESVLTRACQGKSTSATPGLKHTVRAHTSELTVVGAWGRLRDLKTEAFGRVLNPRKTDELRFAARFVLVRFYLHLMLERIRGQTRGTRRWRWTRPVLSHSSGSRLCVRGASASTTGLGRHDLYGVDGLR